jgi:flagellin-like hook-associated protein FlgL
VSGNDIEITDANGVAFQVDLSGALTINDIINAINAAAATAGASITAAVSTNGAGLQLTGPGGPNPITVTSVNLSPVAGELGIAKTGTSTLLDGDVVGAFTQTGIFSALYRLRDGLLADDSSEITAAGGLINQLQRDTASIAGRVGARSRDMQARVQQTEDAVTATTGLLSELKDVDFVEAVTRFQQAQSSLQATLQVGSQSLSLSLMDFLR